MKGAILVVSDDLSERKSIARILQSFGCAVELAEGGKRALDLAERGKFEAAIVAMVAGPAGEVIVHELSGAVRRVIALVDPANQQVKPDRALFPANTILLRPLDQQKLIASIAELRGLSQTDHVVYAPAAFGFEGCTFDVAGRTFVDCIGRETPLTRSEAEMLRTFVRSPGRVLSRDQLRRAVAGRGVEAYDRSVDILVKRLRRKIEPDPSSPRFILTISGAGYKFATSPRCIEPGKTLSGAILAGEAQAALLSPPSNEGNLLTIAGRGGPLEFQSEQRQLTVLCCGLANTATLSGNGDLEDAGNAISVFRRTATEVIARLGGTITRSAVEEILALFGYPQAHEDDAERAVQAALDLVAQFEKILSPGGTPLSVQTVIATGLALIGPDQEAIGPPLVVASRLRIAAPLNATLATAATRKLVRGIFSFEHHLVHAFEDISEPVTTYRVTGRQQSRTRFESMRGDRLTPFVGRQKELELLRSLWEQANHGLGQVALICGESGIGKSRTFEALLDGVARERCAIFRCQCSPQHVNSPYHPIIRHLENAAGFDSKAGPGRNLEKLEEALSVEGPVSSLDLAVCAALLSMPTGDRYLPPNLTPKRQKDFTNAALVRHVLAVARRQPLIVKLADAHWADSSTLELLDRIIASIATEPVLLVVTCRPEFFAPWLEHSHVSMVRLNRLERNLAQGMVVHVAGGALSDRVCEQIVAKSDGVPLFVEELTKMIVESESSGSATSQHGGSGSLPPVIPETLAESLTARLDKVGHAKLVAQIGSAIGREFSYGLLAEVAQMSANALRSALEQLAAPELIFVRGEPPDSTYTFKHALVQDAAYATLPGSKKRQLHGVIARAIENEFPECSRTQPEIIGHHLAQAGQPEKAIEYFRIAAHREMEQSANAEAISHLMRALKLLQSIPENPKNLRVALRLETMLAQAMIAMHGYAAPQTKEALLRARALTGGQADCPEKFAILYGLWAASYVGGGSSEQQQTANELLAEAQQQGDSAALCMAHRAVGTSLLNSGDFAASLPHLDRARVLYDPEGHSTLRHQYGQDIGAATLCYLSWTLWHLGSPERADVIAHEALRRANELSHPHTLVYTLAHARGFMNIFRRRTDDLQICADLILELCKEQGFLHWMNFGRILHGYAVVYRGEIEHGINELLNGIAGWRGTGSRLWLPMFQTLAAEAFAKAGRFETALQAIEDGLAASRETGEKWALAEVLRFKAQLLSGAGEAADKDVEALLKTSLSIARHQNARFFELRAACDLARCWRSQDKCSEALSVLRNARGRFIEGSDSEDLHEATALIQRLEGSQT